jgi:hypothetical protein
MAQEEGRSFDRLRTSDLGRHLVTALLLVALAGCASTGRGERRLAFVEVSGTTPCTVTAEDRPFELPDHAAPLQAELTRLAGRNAGAIVASGDPAPDFRCRTAFMLALRKAGFKRIGFFGPPLEDEPPPLP